MIHRLAFLLVLYFSCASAIAQQDSAATCGQKAVMQHFFALYPEYRSVNDKIERLLAEHNRAIQSGSLATQRTGGIITLPVVVHIIHNGGAENISDAQVLLGMQHLTEAYANTGYYDPSDGVNTQIQFCMAQRDPSNNPTNGITRDVSAYTTMGGPDYYSDDQNVKDINRWNPLCYINIWLVKSIPGSVVGYAYLPAAHGTNQDGIIIEAGYFGSSYPNDVVAAHEMGHYLGLYHTFEGGCTNNDCNSDGDRVCDTPPDQSTAGISCTSSMNSCTTDALSGFATDQNDLTQDYMDYGNFNCMKVFTQGQSDRMNWFIQNIRESLLACKSCMNPCPAPVTAGLNLPALPYYAGTNYTFTNTSVNAASYEWYINGVLQSSNANLNYTFSATGSYIIKLIAHSGSALCDDAIKSASIDVVCGVNAGFTKSGATVPAGTNINFTNTSTGADTYQWLVNGTIQSTATNFVYTSGTAGDYAIQLTATNSSVHCQQVFTDTVHYTCSVATDFTPANAATLINVPVIFTSSGIGATTYQWLVNGVAAGSGSSFTYTFMTAGAYSVQLITGNGVCSASKTGIVYVSDKCGNAQYQFQKTYAIGQNSSAVDIHATADGGSVLAEHAVTTGAAYIDAAILKMDATGNAQWMNTYNNTTNAAFAKVKTTMDGGYIAIGYIQQPGVQGRLETFIVKTNATGDISWEREIIIQNTFSNYGADIIESADGNYYFTGTIEQPGLIGSSDVMAAKMNASGIVQWIMYYDALSSETGNGLAEDNSHLIICGNKPGSQGNTGLLMQLNKANGSLVWANTYQSTIENFLDVQVTSDGYYVNAIRVNGAGGLFTDHVYLKTDFSGKLKYSKYIEPFGTAEAIQWASSVVKPNGNIVSQTSAAFGSPYFDFLIQEVNPVTGVVWTKKYNKNNAWLGTLNIAADNSIWAAGIFQEMADPPLKTYVMKLDSVGNSGSCPSSNTEPGLLTAQYNTSTVQFTARAVQPLVSSNHTATPVNVVGNTICQYVKCDSVPLPVDTCKLCDTLHLSGIDSVCSLSNTASYSVIRSPGCTAIPSWYLSDSTLGKITIVNDSFITIKFNDTGHIILHAAVNTGCTLLTDTIHVTVLNSPNTINLGPDIQLCSFSTVRLSAGTGFASYVWNDGTVDSTFTAYHPGKYFVKATDYCGNQFYDTINIAQAAPVPFNLGPDRVKCDKDTITISAPGSFSKYTWSANYRISSVDGSTVKIWPDTDTTYSVTAEVAKGCTVVDTIRISIKKSIPFNLGNDTSFCAGNTLLLQAPVGYTNYLWQDGSTGNVYMISKAGSYWLQATGANNCNSRDSVSVKNVYPLPVNFLDIEADICDGKNLELKANGNWSAYQWFNNSNAASVTVTSPGQYWLQVTSADGCIATDTIVVTSKDCINAIYFPNAFTPDNNGNNDVYRPILHGMPVNFKLSVYNRFGEKVFETTDYKKGWDGLYGGKRQPPDTFVWYCVYQFAGSSAKMSKGALILIR